MTGKPAHSAPPVAPDSGGWIRTLAILLIFAIILAMLADLGFGPSEGGAQWRHRDAPGSYRGELILDQVKYDALRRTVAGETSIVLRATTPDAAIDRFAIWLPQNSQGDRELLLSTACELVEEGDETDSNTPDGPMLPFKRYSCGSVAFGQPIEAGERAYPFDRYEVTFSPSGCVNERECLHSRLNVGFTAITARAANAALLPSLRNETGIVLRLARRPFIKHLAIILAVMSGVFFLLLLRVGDPKDLFTKSLGFYGTLWALRSLIVPSSVSAFPTYVDYFVLSLFGLAFAVVLYKLPAISGGLR